VVQVIPIPGPTGPPLQWSSALFERVYSLVEGARAWSRKNNNNGMPEGFGDLLKVADEVSDLHRAVQAYQRAASIRAGNSAFTDEQMAALWEAIGDLYTKVSP